MYSILIKSSVRNSQGFFDIIKPRRKEYLPSQQIILSDPVLRNKILQNYDFYRILFIKKYSFTQPKVVHIHIMSIELSPEARTKQKKILNSSLRTSEACFQQAQFVLSSIRLFVQMSGSQQAVSRITMPFQLKGLPVLLIFKLIIF